MMQDREIKDALAYLRLIHNHGDEVSLQRILNFPRRGIGHKSSVRLAELAGGEGRPSFELLRTATQNGSFPPEAARSMEHFAGMISRYRRRFREEALGTVFRELLDEVGFHRAVEKDRGAPAVGEKASGLVAELELATDRFAANREAGGRGAGLSDYLEHIALFSAKPDIVAGAGTVMTPEDARVAVDAGARFLVSPIVDEAVVEEAKRLGVTMIPGTHTPTEMIRAHRAGAPLVKLFPAAAGGPSFVQACLGPLMHCAIELEKQHVQIQRLLPTTTHRQRRS